MITQFLRHVIHPCKLMYSFSAYNAFHILGRISSSPAPFFDFSLRMVAATSVNVKTSSFPKSTLSHVPEDVGFTGFNKSTKYSLSCEKIPFHLSFRISLMFPDKCLMGIVVFKLFPCKRRMA